MKPKPRHLPLTAPHIVVMPAERMAVVETTGDPNEVGKQAIQALYSSVYTLKFAQKKLNRDFRVKPLRARWLNLRNPKRTALHGLWGLAIPSGTRRVPQRSHALRVGVDTWKYGKVAEILHLGSYAAEQPTIRRLLAFVHEQGYEVDGPHEEEYLSRPDARVPKTLIRYAVRKAHRRASVAEVSQRGSHADRNPAVTRRASRFH
ncbi:MAG TPA: GyrI-like domain-containing protein [Candidatus Dormibacteraeota bacterium]